MTIAEHSQHIHEGWSRATPDPPCGTAGQHTCDLRHQRHCSHSPAALRLQDMSWERARSSALHLLSATLQCYLGIKHRGQQLTRIAVTRHEQHTTTGLAGIQTIKNLFCPTQHLVFRKVKKTKTHTKKSQDSSLRSLCSISSKTLHRTAAPNIS